MPRRASTNTHHHCPLKKKGNCRHRAGIGYCTAHQECCPQHPHIICIIGEECSSCRAVREASERKERRKREEERERQQRAEAEGTQRNGRSRGSKRVITVTERMGKKGEATEVEPIVVEETMAQEVAAEDTEEITIMAADPVVMVAATFNM